MNATFAFARTLASRVETLGTSARNLSEVRARSAGLALVGLSFILAAGCGPSTNAGPVHDRRDGRMGSLRAVQLAVIEYRAARGRLPDRLADLESMDERVFEPFLTRIPLDSFGRPFRYRVGPDSMAFEIRSAGPDGAFETDDDEFVRGADGSGPVRK